MTKLIIVLGGLVLGGCASTLPLHPMTPPGIVGETDLGSETLILRDHGVKVELSGFKVFEAEGLPRIHSASVSLAITNETGGALTLNIKDDLSIAVNDQQVPLGKYLTFISPPGNGQEKGNVESMLILTGPPWRMLLVFRPCPPKSDCVPPPEMEAVLVPDTEVEIHLRGFERVKTKERFAMSARFATATWWERWRFQLRRWLTS